jgi:iron(III) transport system permease protein
MSGLAGAVAGSRRYGSPAAALVVAGLLALLMVVPLVALTRVATGGGPAGVARALAAPGAGRAIAHTVEVALVVTALAVGAGTALALAIERRPARSRRIPRMLVASGLVVPEFVLGFAWTQAYGPTGLSDRLAGVAIPGLYGPAGIVLVLATHAVPLAYLAVTAGLAARTDADLERAARACGATGWATLRTVTLPLLRVPLLAASALVFVSAVNSFAVAQLLGTPAGFSTMSTLVYRNLNLSADPVAFTDLTVVAVAMVALVALVVGPADAWFGTSPHGSQRAGPEGAGPALDFAGQRGRASRPGTHGRAWRLPGSVADAAAWAYAVLTVGLPLLAVVLAAVTRGPGLLPVPQNWTLANVTDAFAGGTGPALLRSIRLAVAAAVLVPLLGLLVAGLPSRRWRGPLATAVTLAYAVPGSALAVGVMIGYGRWLAGSALIILVAYLAKFWVLGYRPIQAALDRMPPEPVLAARVSGAGPATAVRTVVLPPLRTAVGSGAALAFLFAFHELTMSTILYGPGSETFAVVVLNLRELGNVGVTAALAVVLTVPVCLAAGLLLALNRRGAARRPA